MTTIQIVRDDLRWFGEEEDRVVEKSAMGPGGGRVVEVGSIDAWNRDRPADSVLFTSREAVFSTTPAQSVARDPGLE